MIDSRPVEYPHLSHSMGRVSIWLVSLRSCSSCMRQVWVLTSLLYSLLYETSLGPCCLIQKSTRNDIRCLT